MSTPLPSVRNAIVLDTSVLVHDGDSIHDFAEADIYVPIEVLQELDNLKNKMDAVGMQARYVNRYLDQLRSKGNLFDGVSIEDDQVIFISSASDMSLLPNGLADTVDNRIISVAKGLQLEGRDVIVYSRDISLRIRCDSVGVKAADYAKEQRGPSVNFDGFSTVNVSPDDISLFYSCGTIHLPELEFYSNQGVILKHGQSSALGFADGKGSVKKLCFANSKGFNFQGIYPKSKEQIFAMDLLANPEISLITLTGMAGCGKTLISIAAALQQVHEKKYNKIIISRPVQSTSKDIGFLPGDKFEKMQPWLQPIFDNLEVILSEKGKFYITQMLEKGMIEVEALTYVRGRTLPNTIFIIDEAQNITHHEAKALLTRMGENSKIILIGDLEQIDSPTVNEQTSGLSSVINLFKDFKGAGHVKLSKGERSELATFAAKVM